MASDRSYADFIMECLRGLPVTLRPMMGEYILYYDGKVFGGIYDDRFLIKDTEKAHRLMPDAAREIPYPGAKEMLLCDVDMDREKLCGLIREICE